MSHPFWTECGNICGPACITLTHPKICELDIFSLKRYLHMGKISCPVVRHILLTVLINFTITIKVSITFAVLDSSSFSQNVLLPQSKSFFHTLSCNPYRIKKLLREVRGCTNADIEEMSRRLENLKFWQILMIFEDMKRCFKTYKF